MTTNIFTLNHYRLNAPTTINLEITAACNHKCRFCYNYWRDDPNQEVFTKKVSLQNIDFIIDKLIDANVLNVILTGGEPFTNYKVLLHAIRRLNNAGIMTTCNSNLTLANKEQLHELKDAGLPHILTSLSSHREEINDYVFNSKGAFQRACKNIKTAAESGIKISVNNIINSYNYKDVYQTGLLAHSLGASNYFVTRGGTNKKENPAAGEILILKPEQYLEVLDMAIRVRDETGIKIYSLYQYPLCMLKDLEKYREFVGRGCPAGKKLIAINADGNMHACNHEIESYGNIFTDSLIDAWNKMEKWRNDFLVPEDCKKCNWLELCEGGCRMSSDSIDGYDYLYQGSEQLKETPQLIPAHHEYLPQILPDKLYYVNSNLRFRKENGFMLIHILGGWFVPVQHHIADFLQNKKGQKRKFTVNDFPGNKTDLAELLEKQIIQAEETVKV